MDSVIGLFELAFYIVAVLALSAGMTWVVVKVSPSQSAKEQQAKDEERAKA